MAFNGKLFTGLVIAAILVFALICINRESMTASNPRLKARHRPSQVVPVTAPVDTIAGSAADMGNIVYYEPVDPNLLQITATGRTY